MRNLYESLPKELRGLHSDNHHELTKVLVENIQNNDFVAIKGSSGSKMVKIIENLRLFFRETVDLKDKTIGSSR